MGATPPNPSARSDLLQELNQQFARELNVKSILDSKASGIITMAGAVTTLFMGFGIFLLRDISPSIPLLFYLGVVFLMAEILITINAIRFAVNSYRLREFTYPIMHMAFFKGEIIDPEAVEEFTNAEKAEFQDHMIEEYLTSLRANNQSNAEKAELIKTAQQLYLLALSMIPPFALIVVLAKILS